MLTKSLSRPGWLWKHWLPLSRLCSRTSLVIRLKIPLLKYTRICRGYDIGWATEKSNELVGGYSFENEKKKKTRHKQEANRWYHIMMKFHHDFSPVRDTTKGGFFSVQDQPHLILASMFFQIKRRDIEVDGGCYKRQREEKKDDCIDGGRRRCYIRICAAIPCISV